MLYRTPNIAPAFSLRREIDRLFDDAFGATGSHSPGWTPAVDVREDESSLRFDVELPGVNPEDVEITAEGGVLSIRGEKSRRTEKEDDDGRWHFVERTYGSFVRAFQLPQGVDEERISAEFTDGVLSVQVPRAELPKPRKIQIQSRGERTRVAGGRESQVEGERSGPSAGNGNRQEGTRQQGNRQQGEGEQAGGGKGRGRATAGADR